MRLPRHTSMARSKPARSSNNNNKRITVSNWGPLARGARPAFISAVLFSSALRFRPVSYGLGNSGAFKSMGACRREREREREREKEGFRRLIFNRSLKCSSGPFVRLGSASRALLRSRRTVCPQLCALSKKTRSLCVPACSAKHRPRID